MICMIKIIHVADWSWSLPIMIADILVIINNSFFAEVINYFKHLSDAGSITALMYMYGFMYILLGVMLSLRYFINVLLDPLIEYYWPP